MEYDYCESYATRKHSYCIVFAIVNFSLNPLGPSIKRNFLSPYIFNESGGDKLLITKIKRITVRT